MQLIPAIDLKDGHCVRLKQGDMDQATTFGEDPAAMALNWVNKGARRLHLVDLNGAFAGKPQNYSAIKSILKAVGDDIPVQLGGGIRDLDTIEKYIDGGLRYVIIGTAAVKNPGFLKDACTAFGGHIIVGLDAKDGKVATMFVTHSIEEAIRIGNRILLLSPHPLAQVEPTHFGHTALEHSRRIDALVGQFAWHF